MNTLRRIGRLAGGVVVAWLAWRVLGPEVPRRYRGPQRRPLRIPGRTVFVGDREFFVREAGPVGAPPVVLVHGWSLDGEMTYFGLVDALRDRYRVVVPDLRNHGKSDWIRGRYDVADLADELAGVLDAVGTGRALVMGYSLGGMVAMELARRHPRLVGAIVLAATAARPVPLRRPLVPVGFWLARAVARISTREAATITTRILRRTGSIEPSNERWMYEALTRRDGSLFYLAGSAAFRFDARPWIGSIDAPVTVVIATRDQLVPVTAQEELAELAKDAEVVRLPGAGHESILTCVGDYAGVIRRVASRMAH